MQAARELLLARAAASFPERYQSVRFRVSARSTRYRLHGEEIKRKTDRAPAGSSESPFHTQMVGSLSAQGSP